MPNHTPSRRDFVKQFGVAAGAVALSPAAADAAAEGGPGSPQTTFPTSGLPDPPPSPFPTLSRRTLGWLRFLWEKSTTSDDWSSNGVPHPWWDRYTAPVVLSYGRFDLSYSTYALLMMADQTPAWREGYARIADGLASRYPTYWGAIDWLTQIGDDPKRANYPPPVMAPIPAALRGKYNRYGWTANGTEPWGLQPDPVGADGNLFYRGWLTLVLAIYKYVSGDDKYARPFTVTGYHDERFEWDQHRMAARLESQYRAHSEGPHCENTKIWFFCNSAAGLGLHLYDKVYGRQTHRAFQNFLEYAKQNYIGVKDGKLDWITAFYDPIANFKFNGPASSGLNTAFMVLPQDREMGLYLYDAAANAAGWRNPAATVRANALGQILARELGDDAVATRLSQAAEREFEPRYFGDQREKFGWWFNMSEGFPRGQQSAMMMVAEVGRGGDWVRAFDAPHLDKFTAPTVEGIDFPAMGVYQAWNDVASGALYLGTYAAAPDRRGAATNWRVTNLPDATRVTITADGQPFTRFEATSATAIRIDGTIDSRQFRIVTGYRGGDRRAESGPGQDERRQPATAIAGLVPAACAGETPRPGAGNVPAPSGAGCPCCGA